MDHVFGPSPNAPSLVERRRFLVVVGRWKPRSHPYHQRVHLIKPPSQHNYHKQSQLRRLLRCFLTLVSCEFVGSIRFIACPVIQVGKGEVSFLSLPVVARGSIPPIYRRALFGHRATPWSGPLARRQVGSTTGGTTASDKNIKPSRRKCIHRNRRLSVCHLRLNFMARIRIRSQPSKARNRLRQRENEVAK